MFEFGRQNIAVSCKQAFWIQFGYKAKHDLFSFLSGLLKGAHTQAGDSWLAQAGLFVWLTQASEISVVFIMTNSANWINRESEWVQNW